MTDNFAYIVFWQAFPEGESKYDPIIQNMSICLTEESARKEIKRCALDDYMREGSSITLEELKHHYSYKKLPIK